MKAQINSGAEFQARTPSKLLSSTSFLQSISSSSTITASAASYQFNQIWRPDCSSTVCAGSPNGQKKPLKEEQLNIIFKSKLKFRQRSPTRWISCMPKTVLANQHSRKPAADIQHIFQINTWMRGLGFSITFVHRQKQTFLTVLFIRKHWWFQNEHRLGTQLV